MRNHGGVCLSLGYCLTLALFMSMWGCSALTEDCERGAWLVSLALMIESDADVKPVLSQLGGPYPDQVQRAEHARVHLLRMAIECSCLRKTNADCLLGPSLLEVGDEEKALPFLRQCVDRAPNRDGYLGLAEAHSRMGNDNLAQEYRDKAEALKGKWD